jgi:transposase
MTAPDELAAVVGIDWADRHHDVALQAGETAPVERLRLAHTPEAIGEWLAALRQRFGARPIGIAVETSRGPLIHALLEHDFVVLYPVNPRSLKRFRETFAPSGAKDDIPDADLLREMLLKHRDRLRAWRPDDEETRALRRLVESRRRTVDLRTKLTQQLTAALKEYFPQALEWTGEELSSAMACDFLLTWPTLEAVQRARRKTVERFYTTHNCRRPERIAERLEAIHLAVPLTRDRAIIEPAALVVQMLAKQLQTLADSLGGFDDEIARRFAVHEDAALFSSLPGSGAALAPRLLVAFGTDRTRFRQAAEVQQYAGIAPVLKRSGNSAMVHWRWAAPTFVRQSFHEFAIQSVRFSPWARAYYALQRARGKGRHAAFRALAFKWIRIIWSCWQHHTPYDETRYLRSLHRRSSPLTERLVTAKQTKKAA